MPSIHSLISTILLSVFVLVGNVHAWWSQETSRRDQASNWFGIESTQGSTWHAQTSPGQQPHGPGQWSPRLWQGAPRHGPAMSAVEGYMNQAQNIVDEEEKVLLKRYLKGVDELVTKATSLSPGLLGAGTGGSTTMSSQSRAINLLAAIKEADGSTFSLDAILQSLSQNRRKQGFQCPFDSALACRSNVRYRTANGACNSLIYPLRGSSNTPLGRLLEPIYEAGHTIIDSSSIRVNLPCSTGVNGKALPSARAVSVAIHTAHPSTPSGEQTIIYTTFGQFLAHDITNTPMYRGYFGAMLSCCSTHFPADRCAQISIAEDDPFHKTTGRTCMGFARSVEVTDLECKKGTRQQLNTVTSFVDGGNIYGETDAKQNDLREHLGGRLQTSFGDQFPMQTHPNQKAAERGINFFKAGDSKVNEWAGLTGITLAFLREHNRIAGQLTIVNPSWDDEKLFQETRRIVIAIMQHIVYSEYLPVTIGPALMAKYGLSPKLSGYTTDYDPTVDPSMLNVVATAADRFGHSMVVGSYGTADASCNAMSKVLQLRDVFFRSNYYMLNEHPFMRDQVCSAGAPFSEKMSEDLTNHMFETRPGNGVDLAAMNIQRGRDHGLPGYKEWRKQFVDLQQGFADHLPEVVEALKSVYDQGDDVDVWTGGVSESPVSGGVVGPLFGHLLGTQFQRLKIGDRYWYETNHQPQAFTRSQLNEIRSKSKLSKLLCSNFEITHIQPRAFLVSDESSNARVPCAEFVDFDWNLWQE